MQGLNISKLLPWKQIVFLIVSLALLVWFIQFRNASLVAEYTLDGIAVFPIVLLISFFYMFLQVIAWQLALSDTKASFWTLFKLEAAGNALRALNPFTLVGGDPVQGHELQKKYEVKSGADSIVTDRAVQLLATAIFVWVAVIVGFLNTPSLPIVVRIGVPALAILAGAFCLWAIRSSKEGFFAAVVNKTPTFGLPCACQSPAVQGNLSEFDRLLMNFYKKRSGTFYQALILHLIGLGLLLGEVYIIGSALLGDFTISWALILTAITPIVSGIFYFLPGAFGVLEMSFAGLLALAFGPLGAVVGIAMVLIRRARALCWIVVGLVFAGNPFKMFLGK